MADIPVKIGSPRHREPMRGRKFTVTIFGRPIVIAVAGFERLQSGGGKPRDELIHRRQTRVRHRYQATSFANDGKDRFGRRATPRHERRASRTEQPLECIVAVERMSRTDERIGQLWPADRPTAAGEHHRRERLGIEDIPEVGQPRADLSNSLHALSALPVKKRSQGGTLRIHEIGKHVDVTAVFDGCDLDTTYEPHS
jgi:hypothetical protein